MVRAELSSIYGNGIQYAADKSIDGNPSTVAIAKKAKAGEYLKVYMTDIKIVTRVRILNRGDCCGERLTLT